MASRTGLSAFSTSVLSLSAVLLAASAAADDFSYELGFTYDRTRLDAEQTFTTAGGVISNTSDVDTDAYTLFGSWYFAGLSDENGPRARAAFVDRASVMDIGYARTEFSLFAVVDSTDPLISSFAGSFESDGDAYVLDVRYVWRDSGWFADAGVVNANVSISGVLNESEDSTAWRLGVGKYLFETTTLALDFSQSDDEGSNAARYSAAFSHLGDMGSSWQYAVDLGYVRTDADFNLDFETWSAALSLYPNRDFEFGLRIAEQDADASVRDGTSYEGFLSWFVNPNVVLAARYRIDDVGFLGNVQIGAAESTSDADQDSLGISLSVRF